jgi:adenosylcobinamide-GDP ribazoletransferase
LFFCAKEKGLDVNFFREFLIGLSFYTRIPIQLKDVSEEEFYRCMLLMPVIGAVIGAALWGFGWCVSWLRMPEIAAILILIFYIWMTGGLHFDGVADTIDGVFSARDHDKMMKIMKDSRLGSFGAIGLVLLMMTLWIGYRRLIAGHFLTVLVFVPIVGRYAAIQTCWLSSYAEGGGGLGRRITEITKGWHVAVYAAAIAALCGWLSLRLLAAFGISAVLNLIMMWDLKRKIGGITGDTIGMTIEMNQAFFMIVFLILQNIGIPSMV